MDTRQAAQRFADTWQRGWTQHDVAAITALYRDDAVHTSMPFRPPHRGRQAVADYIAWSFTGESDPRVSFAAPIVDGGRAAIEFRVHAVDNGRPVTLAGCVFAEFDADGLAVRTRDYWHTVDGHQ
ncbi:nuclear transport factor 2 family protein [Nonomuraea sp. MG754425]|uniref:nuclear transport factor 2 family protein n=1 Tax=Nonomuraea sp. MG754425 TaxID=2570319 RepID=UPI001F1B675B|nr:nuclear transport factor 2 family protein [Nonomuraea sp. MG754425]MCF6472675.1 nuclear transport factor 2 family protein [Nonomuraea sp. MG754425]